MESGYDWWAQSQTASKIPIVLWECRDNAKEKGQTQGTSSYEAMKIRLSPIRSSLTYEETQGLQKYTSTRDWSWWLHLWPTLEWQIANKVSLWENLYMRSLTRWVQQEKSLERHGTVTESSCRDRIWSKLYRYTGCIDRTWQPFLCTIDRKSRNGSVLVRKVPVWW